MSFADMGKGANKGLIHEANRGKKAVKKEGRKSEIKITSTINVPKGK